MNHQPTKNKDWFQFRKGMDDFLVITKNFSKKKGMPKTKAIPNNATVAPHSVQKAITISRL